MSCKCNEVVYEEIGTMIHLFKSQANRIHLEIGLKREELGHIQGSIDVLELFLVKMGNKEADYDSGSSNSS